MNIYSEFGVKRVINAAFHLTRLGGSTLSPKVMKAMEEANKSYCNMWDLIKNGGEYIAKEIGAPAAWITSGAFNALVLSAAACMAGNDPEKMRRLPDTHGMKDEFLIQRCARLLVYDRSIEVAGGKFVLVGDERWGCTLEDIENAITDQTAGIHYAYPTEDNPVIAPLEDVVKTAHNYQVPVIVDAAGITYPYEKMKEFIDINCDLVCIGGKYVGGPNSTGFVFGRKDLIETIALHSFIGAESGPEEKPGLFRSIGRGYKLDRQEIIGLLVAFKQWITMDHEKERIKLAWEQVHYIEEGIKNLPGLKDVRIHYYPLSGEGTGYHTIGLQLNFDNLSITEVNNIIKKLREDNPEIWVRHFGNNNNFIINSVNLHPGDEKIIVKRFKKIFI